MGGGGETNQTTAAWDWLSKRVEREGNGFHGRKMSINCFDSPQVAGLVTRGWDLVLGSASDIAPAAPQGLGATFSVSGSDPAVVFVPPLREKESMEEREEEEEEEGVVSLGVGWEAVAVSSETARPRHDGEG